jgi:uncharacterized protein (DUF983 family)
VRERCEVCGLELQAREPDTWLFMYVSTALITGVFIAGMLWVFPVPANKWAWRVIMGVVALAAFFGTAPLRKGVAIGLDYMVDMRDKDDQSDST